MIRRHFEIGDLPAMANARDAAPLCADADEFRRIARAEMTYPHADESRDTLDGHLEESVSEDQHHPLDPPSDHRYEGRGTATAVGEMRIDPTARDTRKTINNTGIAVWTKRNGERRPRTCRPRPKIANQGDAMTTDLLPDRLAQAVVDSFAGTSNARLKEILESLTRHLHHFICEVNLSFEEWQTGIDFLTRTGQKCDDVRQEFILLSDVLGVSMLVETLNDMHTPEATESTVLGPFHMVASPHRELGDNISPEGGGQTCVVHGRIRDEHGQPVAGAVIDVWQANADGFYDVQQPGTQQQGNGRALFTADDKGHFYFRSVVPSYYPIPTDGPVGQLLSATGRHEYRPAHIHFIVTAPGFKELTTHIFVNGSRYLESDAVFAVKESLVRDFVDRPAGSENPCGVTESFVEAEIDFILHNEGTQEEH